VSKANGLLTLNNMPYRRFKKTLYKKVDGKWTKKKTFPSANRAREEMNRLREIEKKKNLKKSR
jgi:hypothetical protein